MLRPPIELTRAAGVPELPPPRMCRGGCAYEPKWDGWRCAAVVTSGSVMLQSRSFKPLAAYFPDLVVHLSALPGGTVLDGEVIRFDPTAGRTSFAALQRRVTAGRALPREARARPASFVAFDLLHDANADLRDLPLVQRRARLEAVLAGAPTALQICPQTTDYDEALLWLEAYAPLGCEGLVVKDLAGRYRRTGWWKYKIRTTDEAIIGGLVGTLASPSAVLLGRLDYQHRLRYVGHTGPLTVPQQQEIAELATLVESQGYHPWPQPLPAAWLGRFDRADPVPYVPVAPLLVAEIVVDQAYESGRWRHQARHLRVRTDMHPSEVTPWSPDEP
ncbi:DNA ligase C2 [Paractinoplanes rishiriensis]|uniref:DNA ligase C2 n=1 Tax=Paractinoplanes rishiriensis TaxID=1050105 RepID=A0A919MZR1_9ACTN|nr:DNA ligase C2 [Actinoplanes rishiriensis]